MNRYKEAESDRIPVEVEIFGSESRKSVAWTAAGYTVGALMAGPMGGLLGAITQGNEEYVVYIVKFSDETEKTFTVHKKKIPIEIFVWMWRIKDRVSENDYITFGIDFSRLKFESLVSWKEVNNLLALDDRKKNSEDAWDNLWLEVGLKKILEKEIERYFKEKKKAEITVVTRSKGIWIPKKPSFSVFLADNIIILLALVFFTFLWAVRTGEKMGGGNSDPSQTTEQNQ